MVRMNQYSRIEIWSDAYINDASQRQVEDEDLVILQIEHATGNNYIVEALEPRHYARMLTDGR